MTSRLYHANGRKTVSLPAMPFPVPSAAPVRSQAGRVPLGVGSPRQGAGSFNQRPPVHALMDSKGYAQRLEASHG